MKQDEAHLDAEGLHVHGVLQLAHAARGGQQSLGGNAAAVHACAANVMPLYHCRFQTLPSNQLGLEMHTSLTQEFLLILIQFNATLLSYKKVAAVSPQV